VGLRVGPFLRLLAEGSALRPVLPLACRSAASLSEHGLHSWSRSVARLLHFPGSCPWSPERHRHLRTGCSTTETITGIAITLSLAASGTIDVRSVAQAVIGTALFLIISLTIGRRSVAFVIRWANDNFESDFPVITAILAIMIAMALTTHFIGVHTVLGAFVAGVLIGESPILTKYIDAHLRGSHSSILYAGVFWHRRPKYGPDNLGPA
jgi:Sodium/hydrogen exchanger family